MPEKIIDLLLVEDNPGDARLFQESLRESGEKSFHVELSTRLSSCLERLRANHVDVVVLDLALPDGAGLETFNRVHQAAPQVPILILTGTNDEKLAMDSLKNGAQDYLLKGHMDGHLLARTVHYAMERSQLLQKVKEEEERYELAAVGSHDGLWDWNRLTNRVYFSPRWKLMLGYGADEVGDSPDEWFKRVHPEDLAQVKQDLSEHLAGKTSYFANEHRLEHKNKTHRWVLSRGMAVFNASGQATRIAGSFTDMTDRKNLEQHLAQQALYDSLTRLPNRTLLMENLQRSFARAQRNPQPLFAVFFLDLDRLKTINDSFGHLTGDHLLVEFSERLRSCLRPHDSVARMGGDEFIILLDDLKNPEEAISIADRILKTLRTPFLIDGNEILESVSFGIAFSDCGTTSPEELLKAADAAMYRAKATGKGRYEIFNKTMNVHSATTLKMEADLQLAFQKQEFFILFQPILRLKTGRITGAELLLRWMHPRRGVLLPAQFLSLAGEIGILNGIFEWTLRMASSQNHVWRSSGHAGLFMSINLSIQEIQNPNLPGLVQKIMGQAGLENSSLEIEVPNWIAVKEKTTVSPVLLELKKMGVQIALDHYGTSFTTLAEMRDFPVHNLKLDSNFIKNMAQNSMDASLGGIIIDAAHHLGIRITATGVEDKADLKLLEKMNCDDIQGNFLSPPLTNDQLSQWLENPKIPELILKNFKSII